MKRVTIALIVTGAVVLVCGPGRGRAFGQFSAEAVDQAIDKGIALLWTQQRPDGSWPPHGNPTTDMFYPAGPTALAAYALMEAGVDHQSANMAKTLKWLADQKTQKTYVLGLRANVWLAAERQAPGRYRALLNRDAQWLVRSVLMNGAYAYNSDGTHGKKDSGWDNSNAQYGVLGVWAAAQANVEVPRGYWPVVLRHWESCQHADGGWGYNAGMKESVAAMTCGGVASLFVCYDDVYADRFIQCSGTVDLYRRVQKGIDWLDKNFAATMGGKQLGYSDMFYYLYGVERVGLASGNKYFGKVDWYKEGASHLLRAQGANGSWQGSWGDTVATSFALLFLIRGRNAVIFNKLQYDGDWNNRPRDLANLTHWMSLTFERPVHWQIINLNVPVSEWHDAPILYIPGSKVPQFKPEEIEKLRTYVLQGGSIFSAAECAGMGFRKGIRELYAKLFPQYELVEADRKHVIYTDKVHFQLPGQPKFLILSNGVRPLVIHTDADLPLSWQARRSTTQSFAFKAATNVAKYVTGSVALLRPRGTTHWPPELATKPKRTVKLARLRHPGNWDPEPLAYERFVRLMAQKADTKIEIVGPIDIKDLPASGAKVATLTGVGPLKLAAGDAEVMKAFVAAGGVLVIDAAGGNKEFADSAQDILKSTFGSFALRPLSSQAEPYTLKGYEITRVKYRPETRKRLANMREGNLRAVLAPDGKTPSVIFSREDITAGLVGYPSFTVDGYDPESAFEIMRNTVLLAAGPEPQAPKPASAPGKTAPAPQPPSPKPK